MSDSSQPVHEHPHRVSLREVDTIVVDAAFTFLAIVLVILRFISRRVSLASILRWDDWTVLLSLLAAVTFFILEVLEWTVGGQGYHTQTYSQEQLTIFYQVGIFFLLLASPFLDDYNQLSILTRYITF